MYSNLSHKLGKLVFDRWRLYYLAESCGMILALVSCGFFSADTEKHWWVYMTMYSADLQVLQ